MRRRFMIPLSEGGVKIPNSEIWYTSSDGNIVTLYSSSGFGANIVSNTYENGVGIITFDADVTSIGENAFRDCEFLTEITIPDSVTTIGTRAFYRCFKLSEFNVPDSVTSIGERAFANSTITTINIPEGVTTINAGTFALCTELFEITIPSSVTSIGYSAFYSCQSLTSVYCEPMTPPAGDSDMFSENPSGRMIYVPIASVDAYKSAQYWSDYINAIEGYNF